jgi:hypothetical protein
MATSDTPPSPAKQEIKTEKLTMDSVILGSSVANAQLLIMTSAERGIPIKVDILQTVTNTQEAVKTNTVTPEMASNFWHAYEELSAELHPITINSIKATFDPRPLNSGIWHFFWGKMNVPISQKCAFTYKLLSLITLVTLIILQIYWSIGNALVTDLKKQTEHLATLEEKIRSYQTDQVQNNENDSLSEENFQGTAQTSPQKPTALKRTVSNIALGGIDAEIEQYLSWRDAEFGQLKNWNELWGTLIFFIKQPWEKTDYNALSKQSQNHIHYVTAQYVQHAISRYLLPILYGLLGATFFVLRQLPKEIEELSFSTNSQIDFGLRITQGPLAGIMASFLFTSGPATIHTLVSSSDTATIKLGAASISNFSPFAVAFLAGYSVELIFRVIDKIISTATLKPALSVKTRTAQQKDQEKAEEKATVTSKN